jgi:hypothetical protein
MSASANKPELGRPDEDAGQKFVENIVPAGIAGKLFQP